MKLVLVYNPKSGSSLSRKELRKKCEAANITVERFIAIDEKLSTKLKPYIEKASIIAVIGGDGTVSAVAGLVATTKATLIPLPGGTLNHFTKDAGVPQDIDKALQRLKNCKVRTIDIAKVNDTWFINNSSLGIYPQSLRTREEIESTIGKWPAAVAASWRALVRFKTYHVKIGDESFRTPFIFIGNNRYSLAKLGGTERQKLDEGILTVYAAKTQSRVVLLKIALFALMGKARQLNEFDEYHPNKLSIEVKRRSISVSHDGEVSKLPSPLNYELRPGALRILG